MRSPYADVQSCAPARAKRRLYMPRLYADVAIRSEELADLRAEEQALSSLDVNRTA
jgi:hypothetical protein